MKRTRIGRAFVKALKKDSIVAYEKFLEKAAKKDHRYFSYYCIFKQYSEENKWYDYYSQVIRQTDLPPKYREKAVAYLWKR